MAEMPNVAAGLHGRHRTGAGDRKGPGDRFWLWHREQGLGDRTRPDFTQ